MAELKPCPFCGGEAAVAFAHPWFMLKRLHNRYVFAVKMARWCIAENITSTWMRMLFALTDGGNEDD